MEAAVLRKVLPRRLKALIKGTIRGEIENQLRTTQQNARTGIDTILRDVESGLRDKGFCEAIWPNNSRPGASSTRGDSQSYLIPKHPEQTPEKCLFHPSSPLPIPPQDFWLGYGQTVDQYLAGGEEHIRVMREMIEQTGSSIESAGRIMEMGCAAGRMIRWLYDVSQTCEVWGTDVCAHWLTWCKQYLSPPFHFATTTTTPHMPFEDRYFGLIFAGSVFTHIDDLVDAWFQELRRILRPGGRLYITVHDHETVRQTLDPEAGCYELFSYLRANPDYMQFCQSDFGMFTIGRGVHSQVFFDLDYLSRMVAPYFRRLAVSVGAYCHQTGVLFERL